MATFLTTQILSVLATALTNLIGILTFTTDYWSIITYDFVKLQSSTRWTMVNEINTSDIYLINDTNRTQFSTVVLALDDNMMLYKIHNGIFRQCNYLSSDIQSRLVIPKCRTFKIANNQYNDLIHGLLNPGREFMRLHNVAASCAIVISLLLCTCTLIGIIVGILSGVVLATMTVGVIYLIATMFSTFIIVIMHTIMKGERKPLNCLALEILTDEICSSRSIQPSYSFIFGGLLVILCFITSVLWLSLQEKQRKFVQH